MNKSNKQKKLLLKLEKEIKEIEVRIKHLKIEKAKANAIRSLKISLKCGQLITPYVIASSLIFGGFSLLGVTPFYRDKHKQNLWEEKDIDSFGNIRYEQQYEQYKVYQNYISHYSKWTTNQDGYYTRNVEIYLLKDITEETIMKLLTENNITSLKELLGEPISTKKETKNNLNEKELNKEAYLQATIYSENENQYIIMQEPIPDNVAITIAYLIIDLIVFGLIKSNRDKITGFNIYASIERIKNNHPYVDFKELTKKLEIKRNNYDRLTR